MNTLARLRNRPLHLFFAAAVLLTVPLIGCVDDDGPLEEVGEDIDDAVDDIGDEVEDVGDGS